MVSVVRTLEQFSIHAASKNVQWLSGMWYLCILWDDMLAKCRDAIFDDVAWCSDVVPANLELRCQVDASLGHCRRHGWPHDRWLDQVQARSGIPLADVWRHTVLWDWTGVMQQPSPAMLPWSRWWWWWWWHLCICHCYMLKWNSAELKLWCFSLPDI